MKLPNSGDAARRPWATPANLAPLQWLVLGPFPNALAPDKKRRLGLDHDFLESIGGEPNARMTTSTVIASPSGQANAQRATLDATDTLDIRRLYLPDTDLKLAYAYAEWTLPAALEAHAVFGSDDGARVWINGREVHRVVTPGRPIEPCRDRFDLALRAGDNRILVKVENAYGNWGFALRITDEAGKDSLRAFELRRDLDALDLGPALGGFQLEGSFPRIAFRNVEAARIVFGDHPVRTRWFDPEMNEVRDPSRTGRYVAFVEATTLDGFTMRRMLTFVEPGSARLPEITAAPWGEPERAVSWPAGDHPFTTQQGLEIARHVDRATVQYMKTEGAAILIAGLADLAENPGAPGEPTWLTSGFLGNAEHQLCLRLKIEGRTPRPFPPPEPSATPQAEIHDGSEKEAKIGAGTAAALRAFCSAWAKDDPNGFVALAMRRGVVFFHEGFGGFAPTTTFRPASIGKAIAGLLFGRAVDQGIFQFDEPIGRTLGDWRGHPAGDITFRHCFHHLTGLHDHASHGGLIRTYLDNALFGEEALFEKALVKHRYNGDSYNLVGKAIELATGRSVPRLLFEHLQRPFQENVSQFDLGFGNHFTARYLAKVGHMMLSDGQYGTYRLYSPGFLAKLRPVRVADFAPQLDDKSLEWGIGQTWMIDPAGAREQGALGPHVLGHGASSGSIWRVDLDHEVVAVIGRNAFADAAANERRAAGFMQILAEGLLR